MLNIFRMGFFTNSKNDKRMIRKIIIAILFVILSSLFLIPKSFADSDFKTSFDVTYNVGENGITHTIFKGSLVNQKDGIYASSYSVKVGFSDVENVVASDGLGFIRPNIQKSGDETEITLPFNQKITGLGQALNFTFSFDTNSAASQVGKIWEINLPGFEDQSSFQNFNIHLIVPPSFGSPSYIKPNIPLNNGLNFTQNELGSSGVSIAFGSFQSFDFKLNYNLNNTNLFPIQTEIALPPSTNYQDVAINQISPKPLNVTEDMDGNWLAKYYLLPQQKQTVTVSGNVLIYLDPKSEKLSLTDRQIYLKPQQYWEVTDPQLQSLAQTLKTPQAIFNYVVQKLSYNFNRANSGTSERFGAKAILQTPNQAVCLEFADLFIAIARAAGIPAREVEGYAYTENTTQRPLSFLQDVLHAWPEYYDDTRQAWIEVDPTWANTTHGTDYFNVFDFDHFAFVINGNSSTYPIPAGGYKFSGDTSRDVFVSFSNVSFHPSPQIKSQIQFQNTNLLSKNSSANLKVDNYGPVEMQASNINLSANNITFNPESFTSTSIPPYGSISYQLSTNNLLSLTPRTTLVTIHIGNSTFQNQVQILPFFLENKIYLIAGGVIILGIFTFILLKIA